MPAQTGAYKHSPAAVKEVGLAVCRGGCLWLPSYISSALGRRFLPRGIPAKLLRFLPAGAFAVRGLHPLESAAFSRRTPKADGQISLTRPLKIRASFSFFGIVSSRLILSQMEA